MTKPVVPFSPAGFHLGWIVISAVLLGSGSLEMAFAQQAAEEASAPLPASNEDEFGPSISFEKQPEYSMRKTALQYNLAPGEKVAYEFRYETKIAREKIGAIGTIGYVATDDAPTKLLPKPSKRKEKGTGTAFVVRPDGYLVTCSHCAEGATKIEVSLGDQQYEAKVIDLDPLHDLALLRIDATNLTPLAIMDSDHVPLAEEVRVVGFPLSDILGESLKISRGSIAGMNTGEAGKVFQVDALINPGNSGGPVVTEKGHLAGVAKSRLVGNEISSIGIAVPSNEIRRMLMRQSLKYRVADETEDYLRGPDLAKRVSPAVALLKVTTGPGGIDFAEQRVLRYETSYSSASIPAMMPASVPQKLSIRDSGWTLTNPFGEVSRCLGDFALPSLMGSLGTLGIETLPRDDVKSWKSDRLLEVPQTRSDRIFIHPSDLPRVGYGLLSRPLIGIAHGSTGRALEVLATVPALEVCDYKIVGQKGDIVEIEKTHRLTAISEEGEEAAFVVQGSAKIQFNQREGRLESLQYRGEAQMKLNNEVFKSPIVLQLTRNDQLLEQMPRLAYSKKASSSTKRSKPRTAQPVPASEPLPKVKGLSKLRLD